MFFAIQFHRDLDLIQLSQSTIGQSKVQPVDLFAQAGAAVLLKLEKSRRQAQGVEGVQA
jgi:hypothetical protein